MEPIVRTTGHSFTGGTFQARIRYRGPAADDTMRELFDHFVIVLNSDSPYTTSQLLSVIEMHDSDLEDGPLAGLLTRTVTYRAKLAIDDHKFDIRIRVVFDEPVHEQLVKAILNGAAVHHIMHELEHTLCERDAAIVDSTLPNGDMFATMAPVGKLAITEDMLRNGDAPDGILIVELGNRDGSSLAFSVSDLLRRAGSSGN